jgi:PKD repeat protein
MFTLSVKSEYRSTLSMTNFFKSWISAAAGFTALLACHAAIAQQEQLPACGSTYMQQQADLADPVGAKQRAAIWQQITQIANNPSKRLPSARKQIIPVVVHIIHANGGENIDRSQVVDAIRVLNLDFSKTNSDTSDIISPFQPIIGKPNIEFRLAKLDPNGRCTDGITRTYTPLTASADDNVKALVRWDPSRYLNIWVVRTISFGAGGYAYYPCTSPLVDGIVVLFTQFGSIGPSSGSNFAARTLTHEVGHYLDLPHTWGNSNSPGAASNCGIDDGIADTPNTVGVSNQTCNTNFQSCGQLSNVQNYMDYSSCGKMFTAGQAAAMQAALQMSCRSTLWDSLNLVFTGTSDGYNATICKPTAAFKVSQKEICEGTCVNFQDKSFNAPVDSSWFWNWSFPGGNPSVSTSQNPTVCYPQAGSYGASLTVTNAGGTSSVSFPILVEVNALTGKNAPFNEGFEHAGFPVDPTLNPDLDWKIKAPSNGTGWERTSSASIEGTASLRVRNQNMSFDSITSLVSPAIELNGLSQPVLKFKIAYRERIGATGRIDRLRVLVSTNCGQSWQLRYAKSGVALANNNQPAPVNFIPGSNDWREETINLNSISNFSQLRIKFEASSDGGNTLYLDDIRFGSAVTGLPEVNESSFFSLAAVPNPTNGNGVIRWEAPAGTTAKISVFDALGRFVSSITVTGNGVESEVLMNEVLNNQAAGIYLIQMQAGTRLLKQRLVIE